MPGTAPLFDTVLARQRLARAIAQGAADFLLIRSAEDMIERLRAVQRPFQMIADIGTPGPHLAQLLSAGWPQSRVLRVAPLALTAQGETGVGVVGDVERLPIAAGSLDLAVSALALQSANDLPGALVQIRRALKPDGLFLGAILGGRSLHELRTALIDAESETSGGVSPRVAPFADVRDMGGLLQRAGFALPVADSDVLTVRYDHLFALMADLRRMGATNTLVGRSRRPTSRAVFLRAAERYRERFADADGRIRATFEIVSLSGWAPDPGQQKPARRGSGQISLAAVLGDRMPLSEN